MILTGNVALESMGFDVRLRRRPRGRLEPEEDVYWGPEDVWLDDERYTGVRDLQSRSARCRWA